MSWIDWVGSFELTQRLPASADAQRVPVVASFPIL
nr:hypothetical protein [Vibrio cholerae O1]